MHISVCGGNTRVGARGTRKRESTMKRSFYVIALMLIGYAVITGLVTAATNQWPMTDSADLIDMLQGNDQIQLREGSDMISTGWGSDTVSLGRARESGEEPEGGMDYITFVDGDARLYFHQGSEVNENPSTPVFIEYLESDENLLVRTSNDFVIQLGL